MSKVADLIAVIRSDCGFSGLGPSGRDALCALLEQYESDFRAVDALVKDLRYQLEALKRDVRGGRIP
jgi:hypothetical protein